MNDDLKIVFKCDSTKSICLVRLLKSAFILLVLTYYESSSWTITMKRKIKTMMGSRQQNPIVTG
ncbi:hypothetical protein Lalb_Chr11g0062511 [Lupinus albus]|uniref:Uncharacterized protein n=1 Tax=Lupinus albus TaxID=3870 RepID=A0A6A4PPQ3_LUPAL|nr:hypothetical protein Lalb_Chr11g0062511 [Lupinus albus]